MKYRSFPLLLLIPMVFLLFLHTVNSGDFFHHLNTGKYILEHGELPRIDTWSFTAAGDPWIAHSWGSGVIYYLIHRYFGFAGISIFFALIGTLTTIWCYLLLGRFAVPLPVRFAAVFLTSGIISLRWPSRPEVMGAFFTSLLLYLLPLLRHPKRAYFLTGLFAVWAVTYGSSAFFGIGILILYLFISGPLNRTTIAVLTLCTAASLAGGYGTRGFFYIFQIPHIAANVGEWLPAIRTLDPSSPGVVLFYQYPIAAYCIYVLCAVCLVIWAYAWKRRVPGVHWFDALIAIGIFAPFLSVRFINLGPILALPLLATLTSHIPPKARIVPVTLMMVLGIIVSIIRFNLFDTRTGLNARPFLSGSLTYLAEHKISGNIYASQEIGAYITWLVPAAKIFTDTRDDAFLRTSVFSDLDRLNDGKIDIISLLRKYRADIVVGDVANEVYTPLFYSDAWRLVHVGESMFVAVRPAIAEAYKLDVYDSLDPNRVPPAKPGRLKEALVEIDRLLEHDPGDEHLVRKAELLLALNDHRSAVRIIESIDDSPAGMTSRIERQGIWELKAKMYLAAGMCAEAKPALDNAERYTLHPFIFSPTYRLSSAVNYFWGMYYIRCERHIPKARDYLLKYAVQTKNSRERKHIEALLDTLVE